MRRLASAATAALCLALAGPAQGDEARFRVHGDALELGPGSWTITATADGWRLHGVDAAAEATRSHAEATATRSPAEATTATLSSAEAARVHVVTAPGALRLAGDFTGDLRVVAESLDVTARLQGRTLSLQARGRLELQPAAELRAAAVELRAFLLGVFGPVTAPGGTILVRAERVLQAAPLRARGGQIWIGCARYVGTTGAILDASGDDGHGGAVLLAARERVFTSGELRALGRQGGAVQVVAPDLRLVAALIDVSGHRGGTVHVGAHPASPLRRPTWASETLCVTRGTRVRARGERGDGGRVVLGSTLATRFAGQVDARGLSGRGGDVEISSAGSLEHLGDVQAKGDRGGGRVLLDPRDLTLDDTSGTLLRYALTDPNPNAGGSFGASLLVPTAGRIAVADPQDDFAASAAGAVYLFDRESGALIATLLGASADDEVGETLHALGNGHFVVLSPGWHAGAAADAGAATWVDGSDGLSATVSAANSVVGSQSNDRVGYAITVLTQGNYVLTTVLWNATRGAATWCSGTGGTVGVVSATNSLVGSQDGDIVGQRVAALTNGNYVVDSAKWHDGTTADVGAATWGDGSVGVVGEISATNSLIGSQTSDQVSQGATVALSNGNYVVASPLWNGATDSDLGAVTWGDGTTGVVGVVSAANSFVGASAVDRVGQAVTALTNGHYVIASPRWNTGAGGEGAVTWCDGTTGRVGTPSAANSLVGDTQDDNVGASGVTALSNGHYVVCSQFWDNEDGDQSVGAVTWCDGTTGRVGVVSSTFSLVGEFPNARVGRDGAVALPNGHYVVVSNYWSTPTAYQAGAVTWCDGTGPTSALVTAANSLVGALDSDRVGSGGVTLLSQGNYVVSSPLWRYGNSRRGAATWASGTTGAVGAVSSMNSLIGRHTNDQFATVQALSDGNYVVRSAHVDVEDPLGGGLLADVGAIAWGDGAEGSIGEVSSLNSLQGSSANDQLGGQAVVPLSGGLYAAPVPGWDDGLLSDAGAVVLGGGARGQVGAIDSTVSLIGTSGGASAASAARLERGLVGAVVNDSVAVVIPIESIRFGDGRGLALQSVTDRLVRLLSAGVDVTLQASQDLRIKSPLEVDNPSGRGGHLTLIAGRSVFVEANVTTDGGDLTVIANAAASRGVIDADRAAGAARIVNAAAIDAGAGTVRFELEDGAGKTHTERGGYEVGAVTAASLVVVPWVDRVSPTAVTPRDAITVSGGGLAGAQVQVDGLAANLVSTADGSVVFRLPNGITDGSHAATLIPGRSPDAVALGTLDVSGATATETGEDEDEDDAGDGDGEDDAGSNQGGGGGGSSSGTLGCALATDASSDRWPAVLWLLGVLTLTLRRRRLGSK